MVTYWLVPLNCIARSLVVTVQVNGSLSVSVPSLTVSTTL